MYVLWSLMHNFPTVNSEHMFDGSLIYFQSESISFPNPKSQKMTIHILNPRQGKYFPGGGAQEVDVGKLPEFLTGVLTASLPGR